MLKVVYNLKEIFHRFSCFFSEVFSLVYFI